MSPSGRLDDLTGSIAKDLTGVDRRFDWTHSHSISKIFLILVLAKDIGLFVSYFSTTAIHTRKHRIPSDLRS